MIGFKTLSIPQLYHSYPDLRVLKSFIYNGVVFAYNLGTPSEILIILITYL